MKSQKSRIAQAFARIAATPKSVSAAVAVGRFINRAETEPISLADVRKLRSEVAAANRNARAVHGGQLAAPFLGVARG